MKDAESNAANGKMAAVSEKLKGFLPDTIAGLPRTEISAVSAGAAGLGASDAEATYTTGDKRITLKVVDLAAAGAFAAFGSAVHAESDTQTTTGYEKDSTIGGRWTTERYDNQSKDGEYSILVGNRFQVDAEGSGIAMDDLKGAVAAVGRTAWKRCRTASRHGRGSGSPAAYLVSGGRRFPAECHRDHPVAACQHHAVGRDGRQQSGDADEIAVLQIDPDQAVQRLVRGLSLRLGAAGLLLLGRLVHGVAGDTGHADEAGNQSDHRRGHRPSPPPPSA